MNDIAIIILNYNSYKETINEIEHVKDAFDISYNDFIVVDNKSTNESVYELNKYKETHYIKLLVSNENGGYAKGNNIGIKYAKDNNYKYALILNNDIEFNDKNTLRVMRNILEDDETLATINPDILAPNGKMYNRDSIRPTFFDMTFGMLLYKYKGRKLKLIDHKYGYIYRPQGCCFMVDIKKMSEIDFFDEYTFLYNEEIILAEKLHRNGYRCGCVSKYHVVHNTSSVVKNSIKKNNIINNYIYGYRYYLINYRKFSMFFVEIAVLFLKIKLLIVI